jgi:hypothetical protein
MDEYLPILCIEHDRIIFNILLALTAASTVGPLKYIDILKLSLETP